MHSFSFVTPTKSPPPLTNNAVTLLLHSKYRRLHSYLTSFLPSHSPFFCPLDATEMRRKRAKKKTIPRASSFPSPCHREGKSRFSNSSKKKSENKKRYPLRDQITNSCGKYCRLLDAVAAQPTPRPPFPHLGEKYTHSAGKMKFLFPTAPNYRLSSTLKRILAKWVRGW